MTSRPAEEHPSRFRGDVEGLRAVAVGLVVADHLFAHPKGGFIGVDVFFVISGFLITGLLIHDGERNAKISIREFYARRARRILPVAGLVLVATVLTTRVAFVGSRAHDTLVDGLWSAGFAANVHFSHIGTNYFLRFRPASPLQHYWSLSVEEQFYLFWPWVLAAAVFALRRRGRPLTFSWVAPLAVIATAVSFVWCLHSTRMAPTAAYFSTPVRAWELGAGCIIAASRPMLAKFDVRTRAVIAWLGLAGIGLAATTISPTAAFPGHLAALPVLATGLILLANDPAGGPGSRWALGGSIPRYIGRLSYSIYLWHWPCIVVAEARFPRRTTWFYLVALVLPLLLSVLSYHLVEVPARRSRWLSAKPAGRRRRSPRSWIAEVSRSGRAMTGVATVLGIAVVALSVPAGSAAAPLVQPLRLPAATAGGNAHKALVAIRADVARSLLVRHFPPLNPTLDALPASFAPQWHACIGVDSARDLSSCRFGRPDATKTAVVIGDSYAVSYLPGIIDALVPLGWRVEGLTYTECPNNTTPTYTAAGAASPNSACPRHHAWALAELAREHPDLVISIDAAYYIDFFHGHPGDPASMWRGGAQEFYRMLEQSAQRVVVLAGSPTSGNLQGCVTSSPAACNTALSDTWLTIHAAEQSAAQSLGVRYVSGLDWFCHHGECPAVVGHTPVYWDGNHLTAAYSEALAPLLRQALIGRRPPR